MIKEIETKKILNRICILLIVICSMVLYSAIVVSAEESTYNVTIDVSPTTGDISAGNSRAYDITVNNTGNTRGNYALSLIDSDVTNFTGSILGTASMEIDNGSSMKTTLTVNTTADAIVGAVDITTVNVTSVENPIYTNSTQVRSTVTMSPTGGGPNCLSCHNNKMRGVHNNVNSGAVADQGLEANKKCWGCHQTGGTQPTNMGDIYKTPYTCEDCHNSVNKPYPGVDNAPTVGDDDDSQTSAAQTDAVQTNKKSRPMEYAAIETIDKRHNGSIECDTCHNNPDLDDIAFIQPDGTITFSRATAATCIDCHLTGTVGANNANFSTAYILANNKFTHSNALNNGSIWTRVGDPNYWDSQLLACKYCHGSVIHNPTPVGKALVFKDTNVKREFGTWCTSCHYQTYSLYSTMLGKMSPVPPEFTGNVTYGNYADPKYYNHDSIGDFQDTKCKNCHGGGSDISVLMHSVVSGEGGPNCVSCHDVPAGGERPHVDVSSMNRTDSIHKDLNKDATTSLSAENKRCWACHGDGNEPTKHPANYKTPYTCTDCHNGSNTNFNPSNTIGIVSEHYWNGDQIKTTGVSSCYRCHNKSEMMISANDPDVGSGAVNGGLHGGDDSTSHYGKKREDLSSIKDTSGYCNYCHNSTTLPFGSFSDVFVDISNTNINNHSTYGTNPKCQACHLNGRIHDSSLTFEALVLPTSTICLPCHGPGGTASIKDKSKHNNVVDCSVCHLETGKDIHPIKYLSNTDTFTQNKMQGAKCDTCHETGKHNAPAIGKVQHSSNSANGSLWNAGRPSIFWDNTIPSAACDYCHGDTKHKADALGKPSTFKGTNIVNTFGNWCGTCHYKNNGQYDTMISVMNLLIPPEITGHPTYGNYVTASDGTSYYSHSLGPYSDDECKSCHYTGTPSNLTILMHNVEIGGTSCMGCHTIPGTNYFMDTTKLGRHADVSKSEGLGIVSDNDCRGCHFNVLNMDQMQPGYASKDNTYYCQDCHKSGGRNAAQYNSMPANLKVDTLQHAKNDCENCHINNNVNKYHPGGPIGTAFDTTSGVARNCYSCHYRSDGSGTGGANIGLNGPFRAPGEDHNCLYCHDDYAGFGERPPLSGCSQCHVSTVHSVTVGDHSSVKYPIVDTVSITTPVSAGTSATVRAKAYSRYVQIAKAQYSINGGAWIDMTAEDGVFNSKEEYVTGSVNTAAMIGSYTITVRAMDSGHVKQSGGIAHNSAIPYYPNNGVWTKISSPVTLTVTAGTNPNPIWHEWTWTGGTSTIGPSISEFNGKLYAIGVGTDGNVYVNSMDTSGTWSGWTSVSLSSTIEPSITTFDGKLYAIGVGTDGRIYTNSMDTSGTWSGWTWTGGTSTIGPSISEFNGKLYAIGVGTDGNVYVNSMDTSGTWSGWTWTGGTSTIGPSISEFNGKLYAIGVGTDGNVYVNSMDTSGTWSGWTSVSLSSTIEPSITTFDGKLYAIGVGTDGRIYTNSMDTSGTWSGWTWTGGTSTIGPSISEFNGKLYAIGVGTDGNVYVNSMDTSGTWSGWTWTGGTSTIGPSISEFNGKLYAIGVGTDGNVYVNSMDTSGTWSGWTYISMSSSVRASISEFNGKLYAIAVGMDGKIYTNNLS